MRLLASLQGAAALSASWLAKKKTQSPAGDCCASDRPRHLESRLFIRSIVIKRLSLILSQGLDNATVTTMPAPAFGFSAGDFISAISLIKTLVKALNDATGSKAQYRLLIEALLNLERALTEVKGLRVAAAQASQRVALEQVASQCQQAIELFLEKNAKFDATLSLTASASKWNWRTNLHKIQWALCGEEAVRRLRAELTGHTLTINTLLATLHFSATRLQEETARNQEIAARDHRSVSDDTNSIVRTNTALMNAQTEHVVSIATQMAKFSTRDQSADLQTIIHNVLDTNMKIYTIVLGMQKLQQYIPPQIDRQQPVLFEDAHGRIAPFHVEFINSFAAFQAVMEVRFRHVPGLKKVQNNEYAIQERRSKRNLDLRAPWESVFLPGRKFNMSMTFHRQQNPVSSCPGCQTENAVSTDQDDAEIQCANLECNMWYQRIVEVHEDPGTRTFDASSLQSGTSPTLSSLGKRKRARGLSETDAEDKIQHFRRVQVIHQQFLSQGSPSLPQGQGMQGRPPTTSPATPTPPKPARKPLPDGSARTPLPNKTARKPLPDGSASERKPLPGAPPAPPVEAAAPPRKVVKLKLNFGKKEPSSSAQAPPTP
ncbi:hypothetical protein BDZ45DRAFT_745206 [Acephala macrosclerotiorum]|nr:hypothetical protein BDZ45DRAFT_745206 [Acephala macrosclerotiorum]